ncbi:MAG: HD domain-containing protein [Bacteroidales bacterium]|jgi:putative nucleotidyltransferase with HDIG domain|nr:HD domain-containing protein [Bacteroidales bacterium]
MITQNTVELYKSWFDNYVNQFVRQYPELAENIGIKADHSRKVSNEIVGIAENLKLNKEEVLLAETIGLFHDVGRFIQFVKYGTFSDSKSQNHAELGVEVLKENNILKDLSKEYQQIIYESILNHSRAEIIQDKNEKIIFFSKLIRDADKLDIWRLITEYYVVKEQKENKTLELELPDKDEISDIVFESIIAKKVVMKESMKTLNDFKLLQISWLFDLNFDYSIDRLYNKKYLDKIFETLPENLQISQVKEIVNKYFRNHNESFTY